MLRTLGKLFGYILLIILTGCTSNSEDGAILVNIVNNTSQILENPSVSSVIGHKQCPERGCGFYQYETIAEGQESEYGTFDFFNAKCIAIEADSYFRGGVDCYLTDYLEPNKYSYYVFDDSSMNYLDVSE